MVRPNPEPEITYYDPSAGFFRKSRDGPSSSERRNDFSSSNHTDRERKHKTTNVAKQEDSENEKYDMNKILEDIQYLGSSNMTWKERKKMENQRVVALGGKPPKKHRVPLSVAKVPMKRQKQREQKKIEEERILGGFIRRASRPKVEKRKPEDRVLRASEGHFSKGVLNVKHLLGGAPSRSNGDDGGYHMKTGKGKGKGKGRGKGKGKKGKKRGH